MACRTLAIFAPSEVTVSKPLPFLNLVEAAELLHIGEPTRSDLARERALSGVEVGGRGRSRCTNRNIWLGMGSKLATVGALAR